MQDKFGKLKDVNDIEWHWWASYKDNFFNMNPPMIKPLKEFIVEIRELLNKQKPFVYEDTSVQFVAKQKLCRNINRILFGKEDAFELSNKPSKYIFLPEDLALLLIELDT